MAEEDMTEQDEAANDDSGAKDVASGVKAPRSMSRRAARTLRRARQTYNTDGWQESGEVAFLIREATVLALMDLAAAIRETKDSSEEASSGAS